MIKCKHCGIKTKNPKFCSRSCSASFNNKIARKRVPKKRYCKVCGKELPILRDKNGKLLIKRLHESCKKTVDWSKATKGQFIEKRKYQVHSRIRELARITYKNNGGNTCCIVCGYSNHYEVCHKIAIKDFPDSALISEINSIENLVALCPNHHWEYDSGLLDL